MASVDLVFPPGAVPAPVGPLSRFLPPLEAGAARRATREHFRGGALVLDPFGASPRLAIEVAESGCGLVAAVANPVTRFVLERLANPIALSILQTALSRLAASPKDGGRLEPFLLDLYATACSNCGRSVSAEYFVWDKDLGRPIRRAYTCPYCNHVAEEPVTAQDVAHAAALEGPGLARARALEQVAPADDPDRASAEAALAVYPGRAVYALVTILNKLEQLELEPEIRVGAEALLISAFDASDALWGHPEGRTRPRQLTASTHFREINVWRALERGLGEWDLADSSARIVPWDPDRPPGPGEIAIFPGPVRDLAGSLRGLPLDGLVTVLPRPNQAHWTLSALWTAWLWGREAARPMRAALRRRRYDWSWHASALRASLLGLANALPPGLPALTFVPEAEPGFLSAALAGLDTAGFRLTGKALRVEEEQALLSWEAAPGPSTGVEVGLWRARLADSAREILEEWAQPARYFVLHAAAWCDLAGRRWLSPLWSEAEEHPMGRVADEFEKTLGDRRRFHRMDSRSEVESGIFWMGDPPRGNAPWADRIELAVLESLRSKGASTLPDMEEEAATRFRGLLSPDRLLVRECLASYAIEDPDSRGSWVLREEDTAAARQADQAELAQRIVELAQRLGFRPEGVDPVRWMDSRGREVFRFSIRESAAFGELLEGPSASKAVAVIPGGRGALVTEKARRDPRLDAWLRERWKVVKFRHLRRLSEESTLRPENLIERLGIDLPGREDPQLPLL